MTIQELIAQPEGKTLEFKRSLESHPNIIKAIIAFANSAGGKLIVGVEDKTKRIVGVKDPLKEEERLSNMISDNISPTLLPNIEFATLCDKTLLVVNVYPSARAPHYLKSAGRKNGTFVRLGSSNRQADRELVAELERQTLGIYFDEEVNTLARIDDLNMESVAKVFSDKKVNSKLLQTLKLAKPDQGKLRPTNAGLILFGHKRTKFFPDQYIQCARFRGKERIDFIDNVDIYDTPLDAIPKIEKFLKKHAMNAFKLDGFTRVDSYNIPLDAIREIIINAFVHADYSVRGRSIKLAILSDRIEIENPGSLLPGLTIDEIKTGVSKVRNPTVARVFKEKGLLEKWGQGVPKTIRSIRNFGLPEPIIEEANGVIKWTIFVDVTRPRVVEAEKETDSRHESVVNDKELSELSKNVRMALPLVRKHLETHQNIDSDKTAELIGKTTRTAQRTLGSLVNAGVLKSIGNTRTRVYELATKGAM